MNEDEKMKSWYSHHLKVPISKPPDTRLHGVYNIGKSVDHTHKIRQKKSRSVFGIIFLILIQTNVYVYKE